jgi:hypothetical protein
MEAADLGDPQSLNLYAYCGNDPINYTDPDGLFFKKLFGAISKGLKFLFKVMTVVLVALAVLVAPEGLAGFLLFMGLAAITGIAGWHNGKLGEIAGKTLTATPGNDIDFRTPSTFPSGVSVYVGGFLPQFRRLPTRGWRRGPIKHGPWSGLAWRYMRRVWKGPIRLGLDRWQWHTLGRVRPEVSRYGGEVFIHDSRANGTFRPDSDIDIAIRVESARFNQILEERFGRPAFGSAKYKTMIHAAKTGKIQAGELGLSGFRRQLANDLGIDIDISLIRKYGPFDNGPYIRVP